MSRPSSFHCEKPRPVGAVMLLWLCREQWHQVFKSEILISKSETNSKLECSNQKQPGHVLQLRNQVLHNEVSVISILVIWYCFEFRISCFAFVLSMKKRPTYPHGVFHQSHLLWAWIIYFLSSRQPLPAQGGILSQP